MRSGVFPVTATSLCGPWPMAMAMAKGVAQGSKLAEVLADNPTGRDRPIRRHPQPSTRRQAQAQIRRVSVAQHRIDPFTSNWLTVRHPSPAGLKRIFEGRLARRRVVLEQREGRSLKGDGGTQHEDGVAQLIDHPSSSRV